MLTSNQRCVMGGGGGGGSGAIYAYKNYTKISCEYSAKKR